MPEESFVGRRNSFGEGHKSSRNAFRGKHVKKLICTNPPGHKTISMSNILICYDVEYKKL